MSYACPCCRYLTLDDEPPGTFEICPVCGWEDDEVQFNNPSYVGGANTISLLQARENFLNFGAISNEMISLVRAPLQEEQ